MHIQTPSLKKISGNEKELVHSDKGRTNPSVSGKLGVDCEILWLDVDQIHDDEENKDN